MNASELAVAMTNAKSDVDKALRAYEEAIAEDADADRAAKLAKATAYITKKAELEKPTVAEIEAYVDQATADVQHRARLAEGMKRAAGQALESKRQWLSALQSLAAADREEAKLARWEPREIAG